MAKSQKTCMEQAEIIDTFGTYHQVVHKVFMYLIQFPCDFLSRLFLPSWLKETPSIYSYSITLICDLVLLSSSTMSYVLMSFNTHLQFRFHRMNYSVLDSHI